MESDHSGPEEVYTHEKDKQDIGFIDIQKDKSIIDYNPLEESDVVSVSIPFPLVRGKPRSGIVGETIVDSVTLKNMTSEAIDVWSISIYDSKPAGAFTLSIMKPPTADSDEEYVKNFMEITYVEDRVLTTDRDLTIWVLCKPKEIGLHTGAVHFSVDNEKIERLVFVLAEDKVSKSLSSSRPYRRPERKVIQDLVNVHSRDAAYVVGRRPGRGSAPNQRFRPRLPKYPIPEEIREMVNDRKIPDVVRGGLSEMNYAVFFCTLLAMEEIKLEEDMRAYDMEAVTLMSKGNQFLSLEVPGLAEKRPSLVCGDYIFVKLATDDAAKNKAFQGYIHRVEAEEIYLKFDQNFHQSYRYGNLYNVQFTYNRTNMQRMYLAIETAECLDKTLLFPPPWSKMRIERSKPLVPISCSLNDEQTQCIETILACKGGCPYLIHGPPGTGKTTCLIEVMLQIYDKRKNARVLVCAPSNSAADHLLERLVYQDSIRILEHDIFRLNAFTRPFEDVKTDLHDFCCVDENNAFKCPSRRDLMKTRIIISTYTSASLLHLEGIKNGHFSHIFLDEAGQASEPETMVPLSHFYSRNTVVVLAGDPKQLGPVVFSRTVEKCGLGMSYMERLFGCGLYCRGDTNFMMKLVRNYRTHEVILRLPSDMFYGGELIPCREEESSYAKSWENLLPKKNIPLLFIGIQGCDEREGNNPSWFNRIEASKVVEVVTMLIEGGLKEDAIGVITPYRQQVGKIRGALDCLGIGDVKVGSVEQFQGQEREVIIISTVRSTVKHNEFDKVYYLGFLSNPRRFNVAITRARSLLVVIGNPHILCEDPNWNELLWYCVDNESYIGCFLPEKEVISMEQPAETNGECVNRGNNWQASEGQWNGDAGSWGEVEDNDWQQSGGQWNEGNSNWLASEGGGNCNEPQELLAVEGGKQELLSGDQGNGWGQYEEPPVVEELKQDPGDVGDDESETPSGVQGDDWGAHGNNGFQPPSAAPLVVEEAASGAAGSSGRARGRGWRHNFRESETPSGVQGADWGARGNDGFQPPSAAPLVIEEAASGAAGSSGRARGRGRRRNFRESETPSDVQGDDWGALGNNGFQPPSAAPLVVEEAASGAPGSSGRARGRGRRPNFREWRRCGR